MQEKNMFLIHGKRDLLPENFRHFTPNCLQLKPVRDRLLPLGQYLNLKLEGEFDSPVKPHQNSP